MIKEFINSYGLEIIFTILTAIAGFIGTQLKRLYEKKVNTDAKKKAAETVVKAVEQVYSSLKGTEKYEIALQDLEEYLEQQGITVTELEAKLLIEAVVAEFKQGWKNTSVETITYSMEDDCK
ncbi:MAG: hypothetical protein HUJ63_09050 [Enterococcus sp.]|nr:hypothetical protein [Enterococcus sp.]